MAKTLHCSDDYADGGPVSKWRRKNSTLNEYFRDSYIDAQIKSFRLNLIFFSQSDQPFGKNLIIRGECHLSVTWLTCVTDVTYPGW